MSALSREQVLQARVDDLEFELAELRAALAPPGWEAPRAWKLTPNEARIVALLLARGWVTAALFGAAIHRPLNDGAPRAVLGTHVHRIRRKLKPFGVTILNERERGFRLADGQRAALAAGAVTLAVADRPAGSVCA